MDRHTVKWIVSIGLAACLSITAHGSEASVPNFAAYLPQDSGAQLNALPGDANGDGVVDVADLGILGANFAGTEAQFTDGDFNGDRAVDVADLGILGANWGASQQIIVNPLPGAAWMGLSLLVVMSAWQAMRRRKLA